jgi:ParB family chromosome partitioning protein
LAELAYDVAEHGMKVPVETRVLGDGTLECLSGHRRLAAAKLAGKDTVPAIERGEMSNASAAATVLRGNLHRENFTTWQEATLVTEVQERRRADGYRDNVRTLGTVMGWSHGKVNMLLRIRRALSPELLTRVGGGDPSPVEELLARAQYRDLERLAAEPDEHRRETATRRMLGLDDRPAASPRDRQVCVHRPKRGGGFVIEVNAAVESLDAGDASLLRAHLETQLTRVTARLGALGHN